MAVSPKDQDGIERRVILLTKLKDGRVKADRICSEDDPKLSVSSPAWLYSMLIKKPVDQRCCVTFRRPPFFAQTLAVVNLTSAREKISVPAGCRSKNRH
jgi:hypothetical protein